MVNQNLFWRVMRFAVVGGTVMVIFSALNWFFGRWMGRQAAFLVSYPPAIALHFCLNKWWTFGCQRTDATRQISEYLVMVAVTFLLQWAVFTALSAWTPLPGWLAAAVANAAQMVVTFVVMQRRVFAGTQA
jgi:putative flippase GtrA